MCHAAEQAASTGGATAPQDAQELAGSLWHLQIFIGPQNPKLVHEKLQQAGGAGYSHRIAWLWAGAETGRGGGLCNWFFAPGMVGMGAPIALGAALHVISW